jgi:hypothetical protein
MHRTVLAALGAAGLIVSLASHVYAASPADKLAGYEAAPSGGVASVSATFKVPTINCSDSNDFSQSWGVELGFESPLAYDEQDGADIQIATSKLGKPGDTFKLTFKHEV